MSLLSFLIRTTSLALPVVAILPVSFYTGLLSYFLFVNRARCDCNELVARIVSNSVQPRSQLGKRNNKTSWTATTGGASEVVRMGKVVQK